MSLIKDHIDFCLPYQFFKFEIEIVIKDLLWSLVDSI